MSASLFTDTERASLPDTKNTTIKNIKRRHTHRGADNIMKRSVLKSMTYIACCTMIAGAAATTVYAVNAGGTKAAEEAVKAEETLEEDTGNEEPIKDETVYVLADADGSSHKVIVSDWLKNAAGSSTLSALSDLSGVKNVKGDESFSQSGDTLTWNADGNDIYYEGTSTKELPVDIKITYTLDGREISPEELAGKSGRLVIRFDYTNKAYEERVIDGKTERIYVPFAAMTGMILDNDIFSNIEAVNARLLNDGDRTVVAGTAFPMLRESLGIDSDKLDIPDYVEITADVNGFELAGTATIITNELFNDIDINTDDDTDKLIDDVDKLGEAMSKITDGSDELYDGLTQLFDKTGELSDGVSALYDGSVKLNDGLGTLNDGTKALSDGAKALSDGAKQLYDGLGELKDGTKALSDGTKARSDGAKQLSDGSAALSQGADKISVGAAQLSGGLDELTSNNAALTAGAEQVFGSLLDIANEQLAQSGLTTEKLTIDNYSAVLGKLIASLDESAVAKLAESTAREQVTKAVKSQESVIRAEVEKAVRAGVAEKAEPVVKASVFEAVLASQGLTQEAYEQGLAAGVITEQQKAAFEAAAEQQMQTPEVQAKLTAAVDAQMQTDEVKALIEKTVSDKENELIEQNLQSDEVQAKIAEAKKDAKGGAQKLNSLKEQLDSYNVFYSGLITYTNGVASAADGAKTLSGGIGELQSGAASLNGGSKQLYDGISELDGKVPALTDGVQQLYDGSKQLSDGASELSGKVPELTDGVQQLYDGSEQLKDGLSELDGNIPALVDGITQLKDGSGELSDGCHKFSEEGINKIVSIVDGDLENIIDRMNALSDISEKYGAFSGDSGRVKFIYKTDAVENS